MSSYDRASQIDAGCRLIAAGRQMARDLAAMVRGSGVSEAEFRLLWLLRSKSASEPCQSRDQKQLAERLGLSPAQVSALVERLRAEDKIVASPTPGDRRRQVWQLTPTGVALVSELSRLLETSLGVSPGCDIADMLHDAQPQEAA